MEQRKLEIYTFEIHEFRKPEQRVDFSNVFGSDLFDVLKDELITYVDSFPPDWLNGKTSRIDTDEDGDTMFKSNANLRLVRGKLKIGDDQGKVQDVVTSDENKDILYTIEKGQSVERPYYFMIVLPQNFTHGFIVLEREGRHAMKGDFCQLFKRFIRENLSGLDVKFSNFVETSIIKDFLEKGEYERIILSRYHMPNDKSEKYLGTFQKEGDYQIQINIIPRNDTVFPIFTKRKILKNLETYEGFFEDNDFRSIGFDENTNIKVVSTYEGNTRTIDLEDTFKVRPYYIVDVKTDGKGFSDFKSIHDQAILLLRSFNLGIV